MSFRGRGRGRGGFGGGGFRPVKQIPFELFPEIEGLGTADYSTANRELVKWSWELQKDCKSSPYYYEDESQRLKTSEQKKKDIERYSDRQVQTKDVKRPLWHFIKLGSDYMPGELADEKRRVKKVKWTSGSDMSKLDIWEKKELQDKEGTKKKENEEEEEEEEAKEEDEEFSDEGDYEQNEHFDDDEDDFNMADDNDEPFY